MRPLSFAIISAGPKPAKVPVSIPWDELFSFESLIDPDAHVGP